MKKTTLLTAVLCAGLLGAPLLGAALLAAAPAEAEVATSKALVDAAKAKGLVGECNTGYLGFVTPNSDPKLQSAVDEINAGRHEVFAQAATKNGVSVETAGIAAYSSSILPRVKAGEYYQDETGHWARK